MNFPDFEEPSSKPYELSFEYRQQYLYVYIKGDEDNYEISRQYWQEIADECGRINCKKLLIEEDIPQIVSMAEMFRIASEIPGMGFFGVRIAFVDRYIEHQDLNKFGELVATNRGVFGRIFNDAAEAENWLLSQ
jgi:hypothetical protein